RRADAERERRDDDGREEASVGERAQRVADVLREAVERSCGHGAGLRCAALAAPANAAADRDRQGFAAVPPGGEPRGAAAGFLEEVAADRVAVGRRQRAPQQPRRQARRAPRCHDGSFSRAATPPHSARRTSWAARKAFRPVAVTEYTRRGSP